MTAETAHLHARAQGIVQDVRDIRDAMGDSDPTDTGTLASQVDALASAVASLAATVATLTA